MAGFLTANFAPRAFALVMRIGTGPADSSRLEQGESRIPVRLLFTRNLSPLRSSKFSFENWLLGWLSGSSRATQSARAPEPVQRSVAASGLSPRSLLRLFFHSIILSTSHPLHHYRPDPGEPPRANGQSQSNAALLPQGFKLTKPRWGEQKSCRANKTDPSIFRLALTSNNPINNVVHSHFNVAILAALFFANLCGCMLTALSSGVDRLYDRSTTARMPTYSGVVHSHFNIAIVAASFFASLCGYACWRLSGGTPAIVATTSWGSSQCASVRRRGPQPLKDRHCRSIILRQP